jgi:hypothetical protein
LDRKPHGVVDSHLGNANRRANFAGAAPA